VIERFRLARQIGRSLLLVELLISLVGCVACRSQPTSSSSIPGATLSPERAISATSETAPVAVSADPYAKTRSAMVRDQIAARGVADAAVLDIMRRVPRHRFVPDAYLTAAYEDHPLPIGYGQTISQPYIVAVMTEALKVKPGDRILEIGTGSGYQAAILDALGAAVYTVEIIPALAEQARARLAELGHTRTQVSTGDGYFGWAEHAPYDAIIVTAAPDHLPQPLIGQLKEGGRLIIPIGPTGSYQTLWLFEKVGSELQATDLGGVIFVPLRGEGH
jgi:protein-L-isoaspartate(D-aspartate) O-methyltransferase